MSTSSGRGITVLCALTLLGVLTAVGQPAVTPAAPERVPCSKRSNYARPFEPATRPAFLSLPAGTVEPAGWLRDWCLAARAGFTGHMDEYDIEFKRAWAADHQMIGERLDWPKGGWPYEGGGYWFDGLAKLGYILHDESLVQQARRRFDAVMANMDSDSILFLWWLDRNNPEHQNASVVSEAWPMWANGLFGRALAGYHAASGEPKALRTLERAYGGNRDFLRLGWAMSNPWPAFDTYTWTGNPEIAAGLTALFKEGGKNPGGGSWNHYRQMPNKTPGTEKNDHVVHFLESTTPWALGYLWTGNRQFLEVALAWHEHLVGESMQPSGVPVADEYYGPTGAFRGTETCDVAGYLWSQLALLTISGEARLADRAERAFFNAGPATVSRDFKTHVYFQCPDRVVDKSPPHRHGPQAEGNSYKRKHYPLCCTAALNRILPNYVANMWMATDDNGLAATHYGPCKVSAMVADRVTVGIECETDYPFNEVITMRITTAQTLAFPLSLRIPGWCEHPEINVNGSPVKIASDRPGFLRIERSWKQADTIRLKFPMTPKVITGHDRNAFGAPYATISMGPLLFALAIPELADPNKPDPGAGWNYSLDPEKPVRIERGSMPASWDWPLAAPVKLHAQAMPIAWELVSAAPALPRSPLTKSGSPEELTLVPYGCTKFRISMFPLLTPETSPK